MENDRLSKSRGQVFTPGYLVDDMLGYAGYDNAGGILKKHVIDNSCGDGSFLCEIADRYCRCYMEAAGGVGGLREDLETYVHGIEIDPAAWGRCIDRLDGVARKYSISEVKWDVLNTDALSCARFLHSMDYVIGNPPYIRVHNLRESYGEVKRFSFAQDGMTDMYLVFYELGLEQLNGTGKLCYITPNSWFTSVSGKAFRERILSGRDLIEVTDLGHFQPFAGITTYTAITLFDRTRSSGGVRYFRYAPGAGRELAGEPGYGEVNIGGRFYFSDSGSLGALREILEYDGPKAVEVKNGYATLNDGVFIGDFPFSRMTIPVLKSSTGEMHRCIYPYDRSGKPLGEDEVFSDGEAASYLMENRGRLSGGREDASGWYLFGRTQGLRDTYRDKIGVNSVVKDANSVKINPAPAGTGVYGGLYILTDVGAGRVEGYLRSEKFISYVKMLKKYKSGGYYSFSSKDLESYLNYMIGTEGK